MRGARVADIAAAVNGIAHSILKHVSVCDDEKARCYCHTTKVRDASTRGEVSPILPPQIPPRMELLLSERGDEGAQILATIQLLVR